MVPRVLALLLAVVLLGAPQVAADEPEAVILTYHIVESPTDTFYSMSRAAFRQQMEYLRSTGYTVIPLADLYDYVSGKRDSIPERSVVITVDDGWKCTYSEIFPVMQELGFPFTVFIYPNFIGQSHYALKWGEITEMAEAGVDIQSHSHSHPFLTRGSEASVRFELEESRRLIEAKTGKPVRFLAYPYGDYNRRVAAATQQAGYDAGLTCDFGPVRRGSDPFRMKRVVIYENTSFASFRKLVGAEELKLANASPAPGGSFDPDAPVVAARIPEFESLEPDSVSLAILGLKSVPFSYDPRDGTISVVVRDPIPAGRYSAVVWGTDRETGRRRDASWTFTLSGHAEQRLVARAGRTSPPRAATVTAAASHQE